MPVLNKPLQQLAKLLLKMQLKCSVAESCTGGLLASRLTEIPGSSQWFECGFVTYSNASKTSLLNVSSKLLEQYGAVSEPVAKAMATGACLKCQTDWSIAITGIAGPDGGSVEKPVGTVWIAWAEGLHRVTAQKYCFKGNRQEIREQAVREALNGLIIHVRQ